MIVVLGLVIAAIFLVIYLKANFLTSTFLFFILPSLYLLVRKPKNLKRILAGSLLFGILFGFFLDFLAEINDAWEWAPNGRLLFPNKLFGVVPIDVMIWFFFWILLILIFYEHFIETKSQDKISHNYLYGLLPSIIADGLVLFLYFTNSEFLKFDYAYFYLGLLTFPPFLFVVIRKPTLLIKFAKVSPFFILLYLSFELTSLKLDQWHFPGQYIGSVELAGLRFPFEEFFFWILMSSTIVLSYYELWVDDLK